MKSKDAILGKDYVGKSSGIYAIYCLINESIYIGQSKNMYRRAIQHKSKLKEGKHGNSHLQSIYNKYGSNSIIFFELERCEVKLLNHKEIEWVNKINKDQLINIMPAGERLEISATIRGKISNTVISNWKDPLYRKRVKTSKFSTEEANVIRSDFCINSSLTELAEKYKTNVPVIYNIVRGRSYIHGCDQDLINKAKNQKCIRTEKQRINIKNRVKDWWSDPTIKEKIGKQISEAKLKCGNQKLKK